MATALAPAFSAPAVYLIGAQKAGTSSLAYWLAQHDRICVSQPKEPDFFTGNWSKGWGWYKGCFPNRGDRILLDASPSYSMAPLPGTLSAADYERSLLKDVPRRIFDARPDAKFIYILRDPVERAYSAYWHARRSGEETRPLEKAITATSMYIRTSSYAHQIKHFQAYFQAERFLFIDFGELCSQPQTVIDRCVAFLGLSAQDISIGQPRNSGFQYHPLLQPFVGVLARKRYHRALLKPLVRATPRWVVAHLRQRLTRPLPALTDHAYSTIYSLLWQEYPEIARLTALTFAPDKSRELRPPVLHAFERSSSGQPA